MVRELGSIYEIIGSNLIATDVPKKKETKKKVNMISAYVSLANKCEGYRGDRTMTDQQPKFLKITF